MTLVLSFIYLYSTQLEVETCNWIPKLEGTMHMGVAMRVAIRNTRTVCFLCFVFVCYP